MPRAPHSAAVRWNALQRFATITPSELLPLTRSWSTRLPSAATTAIPVPMGPPHTSSPAGQVLGLLLSTTRLWSILLLEFEETVRPGRVKDSIPAVLPLATLW